MPFQWEFSGDKDGNSSEPVEEKSGHITTGGEANHQKEKNWKQLANWKGENCNFATQVPPLAARFNNATEEDGDSYNYMIDTKRGGTSG